jgi:putative DNA primase/helicase
MRDIPEIESFLKKLEQQRENFLPGEQPGEPPEDKAFEPAALLTELGLSRRFVKQNRGRVRYVPAWGWLVFTGAHWERDDQQAARLAKETIDSLFIEAQEKRKQAEQLTKDIQERAAAGKLDSLSKDERDKLLEQPKKADGAAVSLMGFALECQRASKVRALLELAQSDMVSKPEDFDRDLYLLNLANGTLNLKNGKLQPHNPDDRLTKISDVEFDPGVQCPRWLAFLERVFNHDQELISFIQRAAGYSLSGDTGAQCFFFCYGVGANGKTIYLETLRALLGDYAYSLPSDALMRAQYRNTGADSVLANLPGARMALASETGEGQRLNEVLVKDLTGGDTITTRHLYREVFSFHPSVKLWIRGNHKPKITGQDEGIWRRVRLIPFEVTIPEGERDPNLLEKLRAELPGVLNWALEGCLSWQRQGLTKAAAVVQATETYRKEENVLDQFIDACCVIDQAATVRAGDLYKVFQQWGGQWTQRAFFDALKCKFDKQHTKIGNFYAGIGLLSEDTR